MINLMENSFLWYRDYSSMNWTEGVIPMSEDGESRKRILIFGSATTQICDGEERW